MVKMNNRVKKSKKLLNRLRKNMRTQKRMKRIIGNRRSRRSRSNRRNTRNNTRNRRNKSNIRNNRLSMRGGQLEYSPLPCDANGNTDWNSTQQVGPESCVKYGTEGAESDNRASALGADLSRKDITQTIKDVVDQELKAMANSVDVMTRNNVAVRNEDAAVRAAEIVEARLAARATTAVSA